MRGPYRYPYIPRHTHMSAGELKIWERFCLKYPTRFTKVFFDWEVGSPRPNIEDLSAMHERNRQYLGKYKIDVVCEGPHEWAVIEVKKEATTKALGEIWLYDDRFRAEERPGKMVKNIVLTDYEMPNIRALLESENVELVVV